MSNTLDKLAKAYGHPYPEDWKHNGCRTVFSFGANEWGDTTVDEKIDILKTAYKNDINFATLFEDFKKRMVSLNKGTEKQIVYDSMLSFLFLIQEMLEQLVKNDLVLDIDSHKSLSKRDKELLKMKYGLIDNSSYSDEEIGYVFKISGSEVSKIIKTSLAHLSSDLQKALIQYKDKCKKKSNK